MPHYDLVYLVAFLLRIACVVNVYSVRYVCVVDMLHLENLGM